MHHIFEEPLLPYFGEANTASIVSFAKDNSNPVLISFDENAVDLIETGELKALFLFTEDEG